MSKICSSTIMFPTSVLVQGALEKQEEKTQLNSPQQNIVYFVQSSFHKVVPNYILYILYCLVSIKQSPTTFCLFCIVQFPKSSPPLYFVYLVLVQFFPLHYALFILYCLRSIHHSIVQSPYFISIVQFPYFMVPIRILSHGIFGLVTSS